MDQKPSGKWCPVFQGIWAVFIVVSELFKPAIGPLTWHNVCCLMTTTGILSLPCPMEHGEEINLYGGGSVMFWTDHRVLGSCLSISLFLATQLIDDVVARNNIGNHAEAQREVIGDAGFCMTPTPVRQYDSGTVGTVLRSWLQRHEDAQVMLASVLVVIGLWWLVRTVLTLLFSLVCPLVVVVLAVVCVPQLREPLLGQNYPMLANMLRNILLKLAENIKM